MRNLKLVFFILVALLISDKSFGATLEVGTGQTYTTIQAAITAASISDTINVRAGTYTEDVTITKDGIILQANVGETPIVSGRVVVQTATNGVTINGFKITGGTGPGVYSRNSTGITISNNEITAMRNGGGIEGDGIQIISGHSTDATYGNGISIDSNTIHDNATDGIKIHGEYITISNNSIYNNITADWANTHPDGIQLIAGTADSYTSTQHAKIFNNTMKNHTQNIFTEGLASGESSDCVDIHIYNNVIYNDSATVNGVDMDSLSAAGIVVKYSKDVYVYNNTLGRSKGLAIRVQTSANGTIHVKNNIISNSHTTGGVAIYMDDLGDIADNELDYNHYNMSNTPIISWGGTSYNTLSAFQAVQKQEVNGQDGDPKINSFPTPSPIMTSVQLSPVLDQGVGLGNAYAMDINGVARGTRPSGAWDMGAYVGVRPNPPTDMAVSP